METIFNKQVDKVLLEMIHEDDGTLVYTVRDKVDMDELLHDKEGSLEVEFLETVKKHNLNLDQTVICKPKNWEDPFDFTAVYTCKDFFMSLSFYSAGPSLASAAIWKFKDERYFAEDGDFLEMEEIFSKSRNEGPKL